MDSERVFTTAAVLDLLLQIDELSDYNIGISETLDDNIQLQIGDSIYIIDDKLESDIPVDDEIVDEISTITEDAYTEITEDNGLDSFDDIDTIEGGILKEAAKSLLLGGMIKFAKNHLL